MLCSSTVAVPTHQSSTASQNGSACHGRGSQGRHGDVRQGRRGDVRQGRHSDVRQGRHGDVRQGRRGGGRKGHQRDTWIETKKERMLEMEEESERNDPCGWSMCVSGCVHVRGSEKRIKGCGQDREIE